MREVMNHWTENDFYQWIYGLKEKDPHVETCNECRAELERLSAQRGRALDAPHVSEEFLQKQRRSIYNRLGERRRNWAALRWAASIAAVLVVVFSLTLFRYKNSPVTQLSDDQLFKDIASIEQSDEPKAIQPLHKLFEE
jgi:hypothetical protein